jgi:hypothetical protein
MELTHVVLTEKVHYKMFSWRTACGKIFDDQEKEETDAQVTCKVCLNSRVYDYDYLYEYGPFGVAIVRETRGLYPYHDDDMRDYTLRLFHPFVVAERVQVLASLPNDELAISLGGALANWRNKEMVNEVIAEKAERLVNQQPATTGA